VGDGGRRARLRHRTIAEIKLHARRQLAEKGVAQISLRAIARQMGLSSPALYHYFSNYEALITALIVDASAAAAGALQSGQQGTAPAHYRTRLYRQAHAYRDWACANPHEYLLISGTPIPGYHAHAEKIGPSPDRPPRAFLSLLLEAQSAGCLDLPEVPAGKGGQLALLQARWQEAGGIVASIPLIYLALAGWTLLRGLLEAELYGSDPAVMAELFDLELVSYLQRLGISDAAEPGREAGE